MEKKRVLDIIVNNAGSINANNKIWEVLAEEFDMVMDTNVKGKANMLHQFLPRLVERKQGFIVIMSSGWGRSGATLVAPYCASKWAVEGLIKSVAKEVPEGMAVINTAPHHASGTSLPSIKAPDAWSVKAAAMILNLTNADNGAALTV